MNGRLTGVLAAAAALLAAGLSTGAQIYYLLAAALLVIVLLGLAAVVWTILTVRVTLRGVKPLTLFVLPVAYCAIHKIK